MYGDGLEMGWGGNGDAGAGQSCALVPFPEPRQC